MTDFLAGQRAAGPSRLYRLARRIGAIIAALVGLVFLIIGVSLVVSRTWPTATGTVESCRAHFTGTGSSRHTTYECAVAWTQGGASHTTSIDLGGSRAAGSTVDLRVHGSTAIVAGPAWEAYGMLVLGVVLLAGGAYFAIRSWRRG